MAIESNDFSLSEYLRRVGAKLRGPVTSPVVEQPQEDALRGTILRDDVRHLARVKPVPVAWGGASTGSVAARVSGGELEVRSPGGALILAASAGVNFQCQVLDVSVIAGPSVLAPSVVTGETEFLQRESTLRDGDFPSPGLDGPPNFFSGDIIPGPLFVERGRFFVIASQNLATGNNWWIAWQEIP